MTVYLLDANTLITLSKGYYHPDRVPEFWEWLEDMACQGRVMIPEEIFEEVTSSNQAAKGRDAISRWLIERKKHFILKDYNRSAIPSIYDRYRIERVKKKSGQWQMGADLSDVEIEAIGRDPFLICAALAGGARCAVVTMEVSRPSRERSNRKIPDVCSDLDIKCMNAVEFVHDADFKTLWQRSSLQAP